MTELAPAKAAVEIFVNAPFFADHFAKNGGSAWTSTPSEGASIQEDIVKLTIQDGDSSAEISHSFAAIHPTLTPYLVGRVTAHSGGTYKVYVKKAAGASWIQVKSGTGTGRFVVDISETYAADIISIKLGIYGSPADTVTFDYAIICESYVFPPDQDLTDSISVTRTLTNNEVLGATITLTNFEDDSDTYTDIKDYGYGIIWASRSSTTLHDTDQKLFGGRIAAIQQDSQVYGETKVTITFHGHASELFDSPELVYKLYESENGRTIIEEALALMNYLAKYPHAVGWFDYSGQISDVDDRITSTHSVELDEVIPFNVIKEILEKASGNDGTSFDAYETPSGVLVGHLRNSIDWVCPVSPTFQGKIKKFDFHRVINKQKVYGAIGRTIPSSLDDWGESTDGWTADTGNITVDGSIYKVGSYSIKLYNGSGSDALMKRDISDVVCGFGKRAVKRLCFHRRFVVYSDAEGEVRLYAPDASNYFYADLRRVGGEATDWEFIELPLGENAVYDEETNDKGVWKQQGSPSWGSLAYLAFYATHASYTNKLWIDQPFFDGLPYYYEHSDATSIAKYGAKEAEPIMDQTLMSNAECEAKAKEIIESKKNPPTTIEPFTVDGDARYKPGDLLQDGTDYYRIIKVIHTIAQSQWDVQLTVSELL